MLVKVFISHQQADSELAAAIALRLRYTHQIESYLDNIDPHAGKAGDALGEYLRVEMAKCTQLMAVVSARTKESWWVPWEIGIATEKDFPIATYAGDSTSLPEYLRKWPYLTNTAELDKYASVSKSAEATFRLQKSYATDSVARHTSTQEFYRNLRSSLGR
jgi:hypothetical protein